MAVEFNAYIDDTMIEPVYFASAFSLPLWPVLKDEASDRFTPLTWGLIPSWVKNQEAATDIRFKTLNARLETLHQKASFRHASDTSRCAVPIDGWFEWKEVRGKKYPYFIHRDDGKPFLLAGLWDRWDKGETGGPLETFTVVTTEALGICAQVHNTKERMPFILSKEQKDIWLDRNRTFSDLKKNIIPQWKELTAYPVSHRVSSSKEDRNVPDIRDRVEGPAEQMEFF
ncbi:MAG: SOS response-associated peptidase [Spirochaetales bacterium]|nr:SOS response-associated peptidase [Spirochaetales bacterium]